MVEALSEKPNEAPKLDIYGEPIPPNKAWGEERILMLEEIKGELTNEERIKRVNALIDEYFNEFERVMDADHLYRLATVLDHEYTSRRGGRPKDEPNQSLSEDQLKRRVFGNKVPIAYRFREVPLSQAYAIGVDGKDYRRPIRLYNPKFNNP